MNDEECKKFALICKNNPKIEKIAQDQINLVVDLTDFQRTIDEEFRMQVADIQEDIKNALGKLNQIIVANHDGD